MAPKKQVLAVVKIQLEAGAATPAPPGGHGPRAPRRPDHGVLQAVQRGHREPAGLGRPGRDHHLRGPLVLFVLKTPPTPALLRAGGRPRQGRRHGRPRAGRARSPSAQLAEIATIKLQDLNTDDLEAAKQQVAGTARSMGIAVAG